VRKVVRSCASEFRYERQQLPKLGPWREALSQNVHSAGVILNILSRRREPVAPIAIMTPERLRLRHEPAADCARYDSLRRTV
jgi:hypothetical protein